MNITPEKDTKDFFALMNTKVEFVKKASELFNNDTFTWIDFGILKLVKKPERFISKLKLINENKFNKIIIPGCWEAGRKFSVDTVNWRFCGTIFVAPRHLIEIFYDSSKHVLNDFCSKPQYKLTWEVNVWCIVESCTKDIIEWCSADHNDSLVLNIPIA